MSSWRVAIVAVVALVASAAGQAPAQPAKGAPTPTGPVLRLGALLPLTGPGSWFGAEIRQGLELAVAELDPAPRRTPPPGDGVSSDPPASPAGEAPQKPRPESGPTDREDTDKASAEPVSGGPAKPRGGPPPEPIEPADRPRTVSLTLQALGVQPLDLRAAETEVNRLLASGVAAVVTASPTPTLKVYPLAAARDVLVLHAGLATDRFPPASRTLLQLRPSVAARADVLGAHAWERGIRRLGLLSGGDEFGRAVRAGVGARWRQRGGHLTHEESLSLDAADLRSRLRSVARTAPEAVVLGFQGAALGEAARALRDAGYAGRLLAVDDDRAALLAGGRAFDGALILADAFVPVPGSRGARFARSYQARHGQPPSRFAAGAYEAAVLLAEAARRVLQDGRSLAGSRLRDALVTERRFPSLYAGEVVIRDDGTIERPLALFRGDGDRLAFEDYVGVDGKALGTPQASGPSPSGSASSSDDASP
jgi:ABC-type branched-subunit amino acid transport system substrate-binding protein